MRSNGYRTPRKTIGIIWQHTNLGSTYGIKWFSILLVQYGCKPVYSADRSASLDPSGPHPCRSAMWLCNLVNHQKVTSPNKGFEMWFWMNLWNRRKGLRDNTLYFILVTRAAQTFILTFRFTIETFTSIRPDFSLNMSQAYFLDVLRHPL